jgi:hypothetical protein
MENRHIIDQYKQICKYGKKHPEDKAFADEYSPQLTIYKATVNDISRDNKILPGTKEILKDIDDLTSQHEAIHNQFQDECQEKGPLYQYKKNYYNYLGKEQER